MAGRNLASVLMGVGWNWAWSNIEMMEENVTGAAIIFARLIISVIKVIWDISRYGKWPKGQDGDSRLSSTTWQDFAFYREIGPNVMFVIQKWWRLPEVSSKMTVASPHSCAQQPWFSSFPKAYYWSWTREQKKFWTEKWGWLVFPFFEEKWHNSASNKLRLPF